MSINLASLNWGSVPDWLAAVGTIGAVWYAVTSARSTRHEMVEPVFVAQVEARYDEGGSALAVYATNVGLGPALGIRLTIQCSAPPDKEYSTGKRVVHQFTGQEPFAPENLKAMLAIDVAPWAVHKIFEWKGALPDYGVICLEYTGRFGKRYAIRAPFRRAADGVVIDWPE